MQGQHGDIWQRYCYETFRGKNKCQWKGLLSQRVFIRARSVASIAHLVVLPLVYSKCICLFVCLFDLDRSMKSQSAIYRPTWHFKYDCCGRRGRVELSHHYGAPYRCIDWCSFSQRCASFIYTKICSPQARKDNTISCDAVSLIHTLVRVLNIHKFIASLSLAWVVQYKCDRDTYTFTQLLCWYRNSDIALLSCLLPGHFNSILSLI